MNRKRLLLAILAGLFALSVIYAFWAMPRQEKAPPRAASPRPAMKGIAAGKSGQPPADRLSLGLLAQSPQPFPGAGRDIFRFSSGWAPATAESEIPPPVVAEAVPPPPPPPPPTPEDVLREIVARMTFLGFLDKGGVRTVFLSSDGNVFLVKQGDAFGKDKSLLAREVTNKELVVGWVSGPETVRVTLIENEALKPAVLSSGGSAKAAPGLPRSGGGMFPSRRSILQQRAGIQAPPPADEAVSEVDEQPPSENVTQEEPANQELPGGEGNGNAK